MQSNCIAIGVANDGNKAVRSDAAFGFENSTTMVNGTLHICDMNFKPSNSIAMRRPIHGFLGSAAATFTTSPSVMPSGGLSITLSDASKPEDSSTLLP